MNEKTCDYNWRAECEESRAKIYEMECHIRELSEEKNKIGAMYEKLLKEKSDLDRKIGFLEGQIEAYQYCMNCRI